MSYKQLAPAWEADLSCPAKLVLISLADQSNDEGVCWPSVTTIMRRTGLCERAVRGHLKDLEEAGHITRGYRDGQSTVYTVHPIATPAKEFIPHANTPALHAPPPLHHMHHTPAPHAPITVIEPKVEPTPNAKGKPSLVDDGFASFWRAYPKKVGKGAAERVWKRAKVNGHLSEVLAAVEAQKASEQWRKDGGQYIPNPATWINQRRWEDEVQVLPEDDWRKEVMWSQS